MTEEPLVSVVVPTFNSENTVGLCLKSVKEQTYPNVEVIVVDSFSNDSTIKIAEKFGARVFEINGRLLEARYKGLKEAVGQFVLLMDSDQILEKTAIARALGMFRDYDMLCLEEHSHEPVTWIQRLFENDRRLVHNLASLHLDPLEGVMLARFYRREDLNKVFKAIPEELIPIVVAHDHAIIYYEAYRNSSKVGVLRNAVWHREPAGLIELWKKNYRYGKTAKDLLKKDSYRYLLSKKVRFRMGAISTKNLKYSIPSSLLLVLKGVAYQVGYWTA